MFAQFLIQNVIRVAECCTLGIYRLQVEEWMRPCINILFHVIKLHALHCASLFRRWRQYEIYIMLLLCIWWHHINKWEPINKIKQRIWNSLSQCSYSKLKNENIHPSHYNWHFLDTNIYENDIKWFYKIKISIY